VGRCRTAPLVRDPPVLRGFGSLADGPKQRTADQAGERPDQGPVEPKLPARGLSEVHDAGLGRQPRRGIAERLDAQVPRTLDAALLGEGGERLRICQAAKIAARSPEPARDPEDELAPGNLAQLREPEPDDRLGERSAAYAQRAAAVAAEKKQRLRDGRRAEPVREKRPPDDIRRRGDARLVAGEALALREESIERALGQDAVSACGGALRSGATRCASSCSFM